VICGPTAAGKSSIAANLALEYGATILSADSRQIYRGFDIGTAKPDWSERKSIRHQGIDVVEPEERYSASRWARDAMSWIADANAKQSTPIVVGGTGFYIKALVDPLFESPELDVKKRANLERWLVSRTLQQLRDLASHLDPRRAHLGRTQLIRAIETALLAGVRISDLHAADATDSEVVPSYLVVDPGEALGARIERRVGQMIEAGWFNEVISLSSHVPDTAPAWKASGYREMRRVARGETDLSSARERIIIETRQYAKRQRTWFRHQLGESNVTRVNPDDPDTQGIVQRWWKQSA
jgi:tRNA dimethylallyltransferase